MTQTKEYLASVMAEVEQRNPGEAVFHQAVQEVLSTLAPALDAHPEYIDAEIVRRIVEPERMIQFRIPWVDDNGKVIGFVQRNNKNNNIRIRRNICQDNYN